MCTCVCIYIFLMGACVHMCTDAAYFRQLSDAAMCVYQHGICVYMGMCVYMIDIHSCHLRSSDALQCVCMNTKYVWICIYMFSIGIHNWLKGFQRCNVCVFTWNICVCVSMCLLNWYPHLIESIPTVYRVCFYKKYMCMCVYVFTWLISTFNWKLSNGVPCVFLQKCFDIYVYVCLLDWYPHSIESVPTV